MDQDRLNRVLSECTKTKIEREAESFMLGAIGYFRYPYEECENALYLDRESMKDPEIFDGFKEAIGRGYLPKDSDISAWQEGWKRVHAEIRGVRDLQSTEYGSVDGWREEGKRRFGKDVRKWRFICPSCGYIAAAGDWLKSPKEADGLAFSCIGRWLDGISDMCRPPGPCNYAGGGLIRLNPITVESSQYFAFDLPDVPDRDEHPAVEWIQAYAGISVERRGTNG